MADGKAARRSPLESFLGLFADVRGGEGLLSLIMTVNIFLVLLSYYVLKPIRDSLIGNATRFGLEGDELKAYLAALMAFLIIGIVRLYSTLASKYNRVTLLNITSGFIVSCVLIFFVLLKVLAIKGAGIAIAYFVWLGIVNVFIIAQFWSYANDIYSEKQGKRLFALIAIGQSVGAILGAWLSQQYGKEYTFVLLFSAAIVLTISMVLYNVANRRVAKRGTGGTEGDEQAADKEIAADEKLSKDGGFKLVWQSKYLFYIALMILVANLVNTTGEFIITKTFIAERNRLYPDDMYTQEWVNGVKADKREVPDDFKDEDIFVIEPDKVPTPLVASMDKSLWFSFTEVEMTRTDKIDAAHKGFGTSFFGSFYFWVNLCGAIIQMFLVSRIFKFFGVRRALFVLPLIAFMGNAFFGMVGTLMALRIAKTAENSTDYSLQNTVKQALFLPTSREEKYKAKQTIDMFFVRLGDAASAGLVAIGIHVLFLSTQGFAFVNVALVVVWLFICIRIYREHKKLVPDDQAPGAAKAAAA
jgi:AAA family ATP:ADP antiporter